MHAPVAMAAIAAGKHVSCEKPIAGTLAEAREMVEAARNARVKTFVWYNYRRCPAVALAHKLVKDGALGTIRHVRAFYLQDWADESIPLVWRFQKEGSGSGAHGDLNAHIIDMTRFVTGEEITEISGAIAETFIKERKRWSGAAAGGIAAGVQSGEETGPVTVDDTVLFLARFSGGAVASFEAARQATGNQNRNGFEINGTKGSLKFDFERMNELQVLRRHPPPRRAGLDHHHVHPRRRPSLRRQLVARRPHPGLRARLHQPGLRHPPGARRPRADRADPRFRRRLPDPAGPRGRPDLGGRATAGFAERSEVTSGSATRPARLFSRRARTSRIRPRLRLRHPAR